MTKLGIQPRVTWFWELLSTGVAQGLHCFKTVFLGEHRGSVPLKIRYIQVGAWTLRSLMTPFNLFSWKLFHLRVRANECWIKTILKKNQTLSLVSVSFTALEYHWGGGSSRLCNGRTTFPSVWHRPSTTTDSTSMEGKAWLMKPVWAVPSLLQTVRWH